MRDATPPRLRAGHVVAVGALTLLSAWALFLAVDLWDVAGARGELARAAGRPVHLWTELFGNGKVVEWVQWSLLAATAWAAAGSAALARSRGDRRTARFWSLLGIGVLLIFIEDAGDPRHQLAAYLFDFAGTLPRSTLRLLSDAIVFGLVLLPFTAALRDWRVPWRSRATRRLLVAGGLLYGLAGGGSLASSIGANYHRMGDWLLAGPLATLPSLREGVHTGFWLMDKVAEESVELIAVTLLCAGALAFRRHYWSTPATPWGEPTLPPPPPADDEVEEGASSEVDTSTMQ